MTWQIMLRNKSFVMKNSVQEQKLLKNAIEYLSWEYYKLC